MRRLLLIAMSCAAACSDEPEPIGPGGNADASVAVTHPDAAPVAHADAATPEDARAPDPDAAVADVGMVVTSTGDPTVRTLDLGTIHLENGQSMPVTFNLPSGTSSFMLVIDGADDIYFIPYKLDGPTGN